jgi:hypothetical protein
MTQDEIIEMAKKADFDFNKMSNSLYTVRGNYAQLEAFAKLVAAKERETCAKIVQIHFDASDDLRTKGTLVSVLDYIRARGEA